MWRDVYRGQVPRGVFGGLFKNSSVLSKEQEIAYEKVSMNSARGNFAVRLPEFLMGIQSECLHLSSASCILFQNYRAHIQRPRFSAQMAKSIVGQRPIADSGINYQTVKQQQMKLFV